MPFILTLGHHRRLGETFLKHPCLGLGFVSLLKWCHCFLEAAMLVELAFN